MGPSPRCLSNSAACLFTHTPIASMPFAQIRFITSKCLELKPALGRAVDPKRESIPLKLSHTLSGSKNRLVGLTLHCELPGQIPVLTWNPIKVMGVHMWVLECDHVVFRCRIRALARVSSIACYCLCYAEVRPEDPISFRLMETGWGALIFHPH